MEVVKKEDELHVAMFPFLAFGHINPFINLSNALATHGGVRVSFLTAPSIIRRIQTSFIDGDKIQLIPLTLPPVAGLEPGVESTSDIPPSSVELLKLAVDKMQPQMKSILTDLKPNFILFDFAQNWIPSLSAQLGIKSLHFSIFPAIADSFITSPSRLNHNNEPPTINEMKRSPYKYPNPIELKTFEAQNLLYVFMRFNGHPSVFDLKNSIMQSCDGIIYKTCLEMEAPYINYLKTQCGKPILLAGLLLPIPIPNPIPQSLPTSIPANENLLWLDQFPAKSVIFSSFGSESFLQNDQIPELALGLELTGSPFLLVLNSTTTDVDTSLPPGFLDRVNGRGRVTTGWVPQREILMHESVGCHVTHCGFSSVMEALNGDCQLVLVPLKADQFLNAKLLSTDLGVGVEVSRRDEDGWFGKNDVVEAVSVVMVEVDREPGRSVRVNHKKWREFVIDKEVGERYVAGLVEGLKTMVGKT